MINKPKRQGIGLHGEVQRDEGVTSWSLLREETAYLSLVAEAALRLEKVFKNARKTEARAVLASSVPDQNFHGWDSSHDVKRKPLKFGSEKARQLK